MKHFRSQLFFIGLTCQPVNYNAMINHMAVVTAAEFSRLAKVSKVAVSKAPQSKIFKTPDKKIDTDHPINAAYLVEHGGNKQVVTEKKKTEPVNKKRTVKKHIERIEKSDQISFEETDEDIDPELLDPEQMTKWSLRDKRASALYKEEATEKLALAKMQKKGDLIERVQFVAAIRGMNHSIDSHLHRLPAKLGPVLYAMARQQGATELAVIRELERSMGEAIRRAVEDVARLEP